MRAAPPLELRVKRYSAWRAGLTALGAIVLAAMAAWWSSQPEPRPFRVDAGAVLGVLMALWGVASLWNPGSLALRWDRQRWQLALDGGAEESGEVAVAIDLGAWMLLRFAPDGARTTRRGAWIPIQRRGHEAQWHALRCAVFAPRMASASGSGFGNA